MHLHLHRPSEIAISPARNDHHNDSSMWTATHRAWSRRCWMVRLNMLGLDGPLIITGAAERAAGKYRH